MLSTATSRLRRVGVGSLAAALVFGIVPATADADFELERIEGDTRYDTSAEIAAQYGDSENAILASGETGHFADALSANYLAGQLEAPILLTRRGTTPEVILEQLEANGVENVYIVGGSAAVSSDQAQDLRDAGYTVTRVSGGDRFATADAVIAEGGDVADGTALIATGYNFADALAAGPLAYTAGMPVALSGTDTIRTQTLAALEDAGVERALLLGGTRAISNTVRDQLEDAGIDVIDRLSGQTRSGTSVEIAEYAIDNDLLGVAGVNLASGRQAGGGADALSGGPLTGKQNRPLLITDSATTLSSADNDTTIQEFLTAHAATLTEGLVFGGSAAISNTVVAQAEAAARATQTNQTFTVTPETTAVLAFAATPTATSTRTYTATVPNGTVVDIALFPSANVNIDANGNVTFDDIEPNNVADRGRSVATITSVNGVPGASADGITSTGSITFAITSAAGADVRPVVWADARDDDDVDLVTPSSANSNPKAPTDAVGVGGRTIFVPTEASIGGSTPTVAAVDTSADYFTDSATYYWDSNDTFRYQGVAITQAQFESMISVGDVLSVSYNPDQPGVSIFNVTSDALPTAPAAPTVTVSNSDSEATANDVRVTYARPASNAMGTSYTLQRGVPGPGTDTRLCTTDDTAPTTWVPITGATQSANPNGSYTFADNDVPDGCYQYRVVATNPVSGSSVQSGPSGSVAVPAAADRTAPTSSYAAVRNGTGLSNTIDNGDVIKVVFSETMTTPNAGDRIRVVDTDGTNADLTAGINATFSLNPTSGTVGGAARPTGTVLTITLTADPTVVSAGSLLGLQAGGTITDQAGITDEAGNDYNLAGSADVRLEVVADFTA